MTILCKHVHRLELQKFLNFCAAHSPVRYREKIPVFLILDMHVRNKKSGILCLYLAELVNALSGLMQKTLYLRDPGDHTGWYRGGDGSISLILRQS